MTTLEGFEDFEGALAQMPKAVGRAVLRRAGIEALEPMAILAASLAPQDEGKLAFSIAVSEQRTRRARRNFRFDRNTGVEIAMGPAGGLGTLQYATHVEFGTVDTPAQPYMRPAWDGGQTAALEHVKKALWEELEKAANRVSRKGARLLAKGL